MVRIVGGVAVTQKKQANVRPLNLQCFCSMHAHCKRCDRNLRKIAFKGHPVVYIYIKCARWLAGLGGLTPACPIKWAYAIQTTTCTCVHGTLSVKCLWIIHEGHQTHPYREDVNYPWAWTICTCIVCMYMYMYIGSLHMHVYMYMYGTCVYR